MPSAHKSCIPAMSLVVFGLLVTGEPGVAQSQASPQLSPATLVKSVIYNEMHPLSVSTVHWKYRLEKTSDGKQETRTVIETQSGSLDRLLAIAGKPLTEGQQAEEARRIFRFSHSPEEQRKAEQARQKDSDQCNAIFKMIPDAFNFQQTGQSGDAVRLSFTPNPQFRPPSREGKVFQHMTGEMWVSASQKRLIAIDGRLTSDVKFGGGLLGHLEKGGQFMVKRAEVAPNDWEVTELTVNMQGKALLFKSISVQQKELHSNFERMPNDISIADAAGLLLKQTLVASKR
ncbi:MAG TPA: hypothetical protein VN682_08885 [Terriglobales bacterium]|nr:hypothetical protein [Terriglobales bacterium]